MLTLDDIRKLLQDRRPSMVAAAIGVSRSTVWAIREGKRAPRYEVAQALSDYLSGISVDG